MFVPIQISVCRETFDFAYGGGAFWLALSISAIVATVRYEYRFGPELPEVGKSPTHTSVKIRLSE